MTKTDDFASIRSRFNELIMSLTPAWQIADVDYVADIVKHGEFEDALTNLIAIGRNNNLTFTSDQLLHIQCLTNEMGIDLTAE